MHTTLLNAVVVGLLATTAVAAPSSIQKRSFKVERVKNRAFKGHNGPRELLKAYQKYSMPVPDALMAAIQAQAAAAPAGAQTKAKGASVKATNGTAAAGTGLVTATPEQGDIEYLAPVNIGGQTLNLDFDSGSSDLWVFSTQLPATQSTGHQLYDPTKSTSFKMLQGASFSISYGDGSGAAGNVGTDTVNIGGATVTGQAVEMATAVSASFTQDTANNGLVGLAFSKLNTVKPQQQKTFFDNVMPSLAEPLFTADLRKNAVGAYEFGRIDNTKFTGQMAWIPVNTTNGFWQFGTSKFAVANGAPQQATPSQAIADTGTTLMLVSGEISQGYYSQVPGAQNNAQVGGITVPCDAQLPDLMLDVGGVYMARIKGTDINFAQVQGNVCFGGIQPTTSSLQIWGDIFFKSQFVAFNGGNNTLGMAQHV
ncbi:aspergillopepsin-F [Thozetella sp. PMI_491]|nr:aspergillopepsin-F [Thozetella sp. PMI_491]